MKTDFYTILDNTPTELTENELALLLDFRMMDKDQQMKVIELVERLSEENEKA